MATINDIVNADSYRGNASAGGAKDIAYQIGTQPLQQLGLYTNFYNKTLYDQTVKDRDAKIQEVVKVADIDANNLFGKDKDYIVKRLNDLRSLATQYAKNPNRTIDDELKWQTALGDVNNDYMSGKGRAISYHYQLNDINQKYFGEDARIRTKELTDKFENTDITTPISSGTGFKPVKIDLPAPATIEGNTLLNGANQVVDAKWKVYNPLANSSLATATVMGINSLSDGLQGVESDLQATARGKAQVWAGMTDAFNNTLQGRNADGSYKYFDGNGVFLGDKFKTDNASNSAIMQPFNSLMALSAYSQQKKADLTQGLYSDKGIQYKAPSNLTQEMFDAGIVNLTPDGVKPEQLAQAGMYQQYLGDVVIKDYKKTGLGIDQQQVNVAKGRLGEEIRHNKAMEAKSAGSDGSGGKAESVLQTPAIMFESHIDRLKNKFDRIGKNENLRITPNGIDKDTRAAMGISSDEMNQIENVTFKRDGSYTVNFKNNKRLDKDGNEIPQRPIVGTIEQLKQGYIDAVKGGNSQVQGFEQKAEEGFAQKFNGLVSGKDIWDNYGKGQAQPSEGKVKKEISASDISQKAADAGYTEKEYRQLLIKNGVKIVD